MPQVQDDERAREAGAILRADLMTCKACTLEGLRVTAIRALEAVYRIPQTVWVIREDPDGDCVTIQVEGPDFVGTTTLIAPGCD